MSTFFTSDLHLGQSRIIEDRKFSCIDEHDWKLVENINEMVNKRDKLFILGDLAFSPKGLNWASQIACQNIELILGNHDMYQIKKYHQAGILKIHGFRGYRNKWLSHCPMHPNEIRKKDGNIHGHIHKFGDTPDITDPRYYNVNVEYHDLKPVPFEAIEEYYKLLRLSWSV